MSLSKEIEGDKTRRECRSDRSTRVQSKDRAYSEEFLLGVDHNLRRYHDEENNQKLRLSPDTIDGPNRDILQCLEEFLTLEFV